jgi:hypothetical protein
VKSPFALGDFAAGSGRDVSRHRDSIMV